MIPNTNPRLKAILLLLCLGSIMQYSIAQPTFYNGMNFHTPEVPNPNLEIFNFKSIAQQGSASYSGDLGLSIPVMVIPGRNGHDFALTLTYNSNIGQRQKASWVGLGWNLDIGHIERIIYGRPDDQNVGYTARPGGNATRLGTHGKLMAGYNEGYDPANDVVSANADQVDSYSLNCDNESMEILPFPVDGSDNPIASAFLPISWKPIQIVGTKSVAAERLISFQVTKDDGTNFYYGNNSPSSTEVYDEVKVYGNNNNTKKDGFFIYRWNLGKVVYPDGSFTEIRYQTAPTSPSDNGFVSRYYDNIFVDRGETYDYANENANFFGSTNPDNATSYTGKVAYQYSVPYKVETETHYAIFNVDTLWTAERKFRLNSIVLYSKLNGSAQEVKRIIFEYAGSDNPNGDFDPSSPSNPDWTTNTRLKDNQLTLMSFFTRVIDEDVYHELPRYRFTYCTNPKINIMSLVKPIFPGNFPGYFKHGELAADAWKLKGMLLPSGGSISYTYEAFQPKYDPQGQDISATLNNYQLIARGRLKTKAISDAITGNKTYTFTYSDATFELPSRPLVSSYTVDRNSNGNRNESALDAYKYFLGCQVGHQWVKITDPNGTSKKVTFSSSIDAAYRDIFTLTNTPSMFIESMSARRGLVLNEEYFKSGDSSPYEAVENIYDFTKELLTFSERYEYGSQISGGLSNRRVKYKSIWPRLIKVKHFQDEVLTQVTYDYYKAFTEATDPGEHPANGQISSASESNSLWAKTTAYVYACSLYADMRNKTMYSQPYTVTVLQDNVQKSKTTTTWAKPSANQNIWMPAASYVWDNVKDANIQVTTYFSYDSYGNLLESRDAYNNSRKYYYGDNTNPLGNTSNANELKNAFITGIEKVMSGYSLITKFKYDFRGGISEITDENNKVSTYEYDPFGRLKSAYGPAGSTQKLSDFSYYLAGDNYSSTTTNKFASMLFRDVNAANPITKNTFFDGIGLEVQSQVKIGPNYITAHSTYDPLMRIQLQYKPFVHSTSGLFDGSAAVHAKSYYNDSVYFGGFTDNYPYSETVYEDASSKIKEQKFPGNVYRTNDHYTVMAYGNNASGITNFTDEGEYPSKSLRTERLKDENQVYTTKYIDRLGNLVRVEQNDAGSPVHITKFSYDGLGNMTRYSSPKSADQSGHVTSFTYNSRSLVTQKVTPDAGTSRYFYDKNGNLRLVKDGNHTGAANPAVIGPVTLQGTTAASHTFTMAMPGLVRFTLDPFALWTSDDYMQLKVIAIKQPVTGTTQTILRTVNADESSGIYSSSIYLPQGQYKFEISTYDYSGMNRSRFKYTIDPSKNYEFIYRKYDALNRVIEIGEYESGSPDANFTQDNAQNDQTFPGTNTFPARKFVYDVPSTDPLVNGQQRNVKGRVSVERSYTLGNLALITYYSYDDLGRIEWIYHDGHGWYAKKISYEYDLQGNVTRKIYSDNQTASNSLYTWYEYDDAGRISKVYTSPTGNPGGKYLDAYYQYFASGKVKRVQLGSAQGVDYRYTERDWVRAINHQNLGSSNDPGRDGTTSGLSADRFGMIIGYDQNTEHIGALGSVAQYNGNASWMIYSYGHSNAVFQGDNASSSLVGYYFSYDAFSRLTNANFGNWNSSVPPSGAWNGTIRFNERDIAFDKSGNITALKRYNVTGGLPENYTMFYWSGTNRMNVLKHNNVIISQFMYDNNGNVVQDISNSVGFIIYDIFNLPVKLYKSNNGELISYSYDVSGNRIRKTRVGSDEYYINGADGRTEVVTPLNSTSPAYYLHGNDMFGFIQRTGGSLTRYYYVKDHLGTIRTTVNSAGTAVSYSDFYPFGKISRETQNTNPRYKFTGKERDAETNYDYFGARYYDSRIGRWMAVDPMAEKYPSLSTFTYVMNNPLRNFDPDGRYTKEAIGGVTFYRRWTSESALNQVRDESLPAIGGLAYLQRTIINDPSFPGSREKSALNFAVDVTMNFLSKNAGSWVDKVGYALSIGSFGEAMFSDINNKTTLTALSIDEAMFEGALVKQVEGFDLAVKVSIGEGGKIVVDKDADGSMIQLNPELRKKWGVKADKRFEEELKKIKDDYMDRNWRLYDASVR